MNLFRFKKFASALGGLLALLAACNTLHAAGAEPAVPGRWLLVFDTSTTMKKLQPATEAALWKFFSTGADGQLQPGDSVGIWLVNREINAQFPTFAAGSTNSSLIVSNLVGFLRVQRYTNASQLAVLQ